MERTEVKKPEPLLDILDRIKIKALDPESNRSRESMTENRPSQAERINQHLKHWGIADDCIQSAPLWMNKAKQLSEHMTKVNKGFFMTGPQGRRKTTCATAILIHELSKYFERKSPFRSIQFVFVPDLAIELQSCFAQGSTKQPGEVIYRYVEYDFLVMDGFGEGGKQSEFVVGALGTIIHHRDAQRMTKRTIITSNYSLTEIGERVDGRIASRIAGMCEDFEFTGEDQRLSR